MTIFCVIFRHVFRSIQMGRVPYFIFDDIPWIPYEGTDIDIRIYGFAGGMAPAGNHGNLRAGVVQFMNLTDDEYKQKLLNVKHVRKYFTYDGVFEEFERFLQDPFGPQGGYLRCIKHPKTEKCCDSSDPHWKNYIVPPP